MKIGFDAKRAFHNNRGLGNYSRDLIRILQERNFADLILFNPKPTAKKRIKLNTNTREITPISFLWKKLKGLWRLLIISKLAKKETLDLYHGLSGEIPIGIAKHTKTIVTIHDLIFVRYPKLYSFFDRKIHFWKFKYAAQNAHQIIAISEQTKRDIINFLGVSAEKISVVYQGCHKAFKQIYSEKEKKKIREKYQLPKNFVLFVGAIEERKNAFEIVKAIKDLDIKLVLIGKKTNYFKKIETFISEYKMKEKIIHLEGISMEEIAVIYQLSSIFCYPSIFEGFGIPIIEALFSKVPVITSKGSCFAEAGGSHSIYINLENAAEEIKNAIIKIQTDQNFRNNMIINGLAHAQQFNDNIIFENLTAVYKGLGNRD